jgi:hypothetical protein
MHAGTVALSGALMVFMLAGAGCVERDPFTAADESAKVTPCRCAEPVQAKESAPEVLVTDFVEAPSERPAGTRLQSTVSLGLAGDGKLTQIPSRDRRFADEPGYAIAGVGVGYGYGYGGYAHRGGAASGRGSQSTGGQGTTGGHNLHFSEPVRQSGTSSGWAGSGGAPPARARGPR